MGVPCGGQHHPRRRCRRRHDGARRRPTGPD
uniref:Uncharacterized protein n=1 Tax=Arundo donax TaxID=35708 RepID=A0A0A9GNW3_ARUDO